MKNTQLKVFFLVMFSMLVVSSALGKNYFLGKHDMEPGQGGDSKKVVNVAMNVGKIVGVMFLTDETLIKDKSYGLKMQGYTGRGLFLRGNDQIAILFGVIGLIFLIINFYYAGKIVEFLKSRGKKAHYWALRWMVFSYILEYKKITEGEEGQPGPYYRPVSLTGLLLLVSMVIAVIFAAM